MTTARITHATPAAAYAHCPDRDFEATVEEDSVPVVQPEKCMDIAQQLIKENPYINVNMCFVIEIYCVSRFLYILVLYSSVSVITQLLGFLCGEEVVATDTRTIN